MRAKVLLLEAKRTGSLSFVQPLRRKGFEVETATTGKTALTVAGNFAPDVIVFNAASFRSNGKRIVLQLRQVLNGTPIVLVLDEPLDAHEHIPANEILHLPFTPRKLINRLKTYLPVESDKLLHCGPLTLDTERNLVTRHGRQEQLTPRLSELLEMFMRKPGVVHERKDLFQAVWKTEYTADTRTLDVHISWLRQKIEDDARKPRLLVTIRGMGYRLDVE